MNPTAWGIVIDQEPSTFRWIDILWLIFLAALAVLPPLVEIHKQMILVGIGLFQIFESKILARVGPARRNTYSVLIKILLASLLVAHTGGINSSYYPIYYLPVVSAAMLYSGWAALLCRWFPVPPIVLSGYGPCSSTGSRPAERLNLRSEICFSSLWPWWLIASYQ